MLEFHYYEIKADDIICDRGKVLLELNWGNMWVFKKIINDTIKTKFT